MRPSLVFLIITLLSAVPAAVSGLLVGLWFENDIAAVVTTLVIGLFLAHEIFQKVSTRNDDF